MRCRSGVIGCVIGTSCRRDRRNSAIVTGG
jgi:hypothetical protein